MTRLIDLTGKRFNKLVVIERNGTRSYISKGTHPTWLCQCDCGKFITATGSNLRSGHAKSCGCKPEKVIEDLVGLTQGKLTVIQRADYLSKSDKKIIAWECSCECGGSIILRHTAVKGGSNNCGCDYKRGTHQHTVNSEWTPTFFSWWSMVQRCTNENNHAYPLYGGAGIKVCDNWYVGGDYGDSFQNFLEDMGERPEGTTLNRIHGAKIYSKETCEWATLSVQGYDQKKRSTNTSGRTGVSFNKLTNKWEAYIDCEKRIRLGHHVNFDDAVKAREEAEIKYFGWNKE